MREQGEIITIPKTGRVVQLRAVKPAALLRLGKIPDPLSELVIRILYGQLTDEEYERFFNLPERMEQALDMAESLRVVCTAALVYPRIVDEPQADDEIQIDDLDDAEQRYLFELAFLEASDLTSFRERQTRRLESVAEDEDHTPPAEPGAAS